MMAWCDGAATIKQKSKQNFYAYEGIFPHLNAFVCSVLSSDVCEAVGDLV